MWDLIVSVPDHCLSFYLVTFNPAKSEVLLLFMKIIKPYNPPLFLIMSNSGSKVTQTPSFVFFEWLFLA